MNFLRRVISEENVISAVTYLIFLRPNLQDEAGGGNCRELCRVDSIAHHSEDIGY
jgi:hypothetical protein